jgi:hypothetical protein
VILWYLLPVCALVGWALLLDGSSASNCADASGTGCAAPRTEALRALLDTLPKVALAAGLSLLLGIVLRSITTGWRAITVGFAAAVVGGGVTTVLFSALTS